MIAWSLFFHQKHFFRDIDKNNPQKFHVLFLFACYWNMWKYASVGWRGTSRYAWVPKPWEMCLESGWMILKLPLLKVNKGHFTPFLTKKFSVVFVWFVHMTCVITRPKSDLHQCAFLSQVLKISVINQDLIEQF